MRALLQRVTRASVTVQGKVQNAIGNGLLIFLGVEYEHFMEQLWMDSGLVVKSGTFGADMKVELINDGPVTIWIDSKNRE